ncbi:F-box protein at3g17710 [Phtheirospermum japonicum]|uniref:F-box protein at3g17710 n=1 Tax=Phtheirospermum japonicum TaxID=374723 RepID=A0A830BAB8_9LAMI|nr:F-box protein at3g17710 [Phtheirospermum japonicum]
MAIQNVTSTNIPEDIIRTILSRLPVKSLLRFRTVSKSWNTMISDPRFARLHLEPSDQETAVEIWIKEKGLNASSWEELMTIEIKNGEQRPIVSFEPLCLVENNKILIRLEGARYGVYSPCEETFEELIEDNSLFDSLVPCVQSLYLFPTQSLGPGRN